MALISGGPISSVPISGSPQAAAATDDTIVQGVFIDDGLYVDQDDSLPDLYQGQQATTLEDTAVVVVADIVKAFFENPIWVQDEDEWTPDWAQAPPKADDELPGDHLNSISNELFVDEDEPVTDGASGSPLFSEEEIVSRQLPEDNVPPDDDEHDYGGIQESGLSFPGDETGETTGRSSNEAILEEDEPVTDGCISAPRDQDDEYAKPFFAEADEEETPTDGLTSSPLADAPAAAVDDVVPQELGQFLDEEEPVTDGAIASPLDDAQVATVDDIGPQERGQFLDEEEQVTDGASASPLQDTPLEVGRQELGQYYDEDEVVTDGQVSEPVDQSDEYTRPSQAEVFEDEAFVVDGFSARADAEAVDDAIQATSLGEYLEEEEFIDGTGLSSPADDGVASTVVIVTGLSINVEIGCFHSLGFGAISDGANVWTGVPGETDSWAPISDGANVWVETPDGSATWSTIPGASNDWEREC